MLYVLINTNNVPSKVEAEEFLYAVPKRNSFTCHLILLLIRKKKKKKKHMWDWHNKFSVSRYAWLEKDTRVIKSHILSFHVGLPFHQVTRIDTSDLMHSLHVCHCTCNIHGISADSMTAYIFLFLMLLVLKNHQNISTHGQVQKGF